ncbi:uncharacterized protein YneR [Evansella vedderi]|uniref:Uncharacterized protein YneR n=1 Tax=Evansella vedderi TaxID=38282 RepID=A0ABT9ZW17_9BACI|nr:HesB/YadR/YfhF family protein [Evansella vedderi]MDQ0255434.1 uncharacterized protein YneR [Evansella vedderi]
MKIDVTDEAIKWFRDELDVSEGDSVQFFVRYGGCGDFQSGFSLGVNVKEPEDIGTSIEKEGLLFFIENKDIWYFDDQDLLVEFDEKIGEIQYTKK